MRQTKKAQLLRYLETVKSDVIPGVRELSVEVSLSPSAVRAALNEWQSTGFLARDGYDWIKVSRCPKCEGDYIPHLTEYSVKRTANYGILVFAKCFLCQKVYVSMNDLQFEEAAAQFQE